MMQEVILPENLDTIVRTYVHSPLHVEITNPTPLPDQGHYPSMIGSTVYKVETRPGFIILHEKEMITSINVDKITYIQIHNVLSNPYCSIYMEDRQLLHTFSLQKDIGLNVEFVIDMLGAAREGHYTSTKSIMATERGVDFE